MKCGPLRVVMCACRPYKRRSSSDDSLSRIMPDYAAQRANMVATQVLANGVTEEHLLDAFRAVHREQFVPADKRGIAYADAPLEIVPGRQLMEPRSFAKLLGLAEILPSDSVLAIGCATGYSTAVIARLAGRVIGLEEDAALVRVATEMLHAVGVPNATVVQGALAQGYRGGGPYDVILIEGGVEEIPEPLLAQLGEGGRLVTIFQREAMGRAVVFLNEEGHTGHRFDFDAAATVLPGFRKAPAFVF
jgi:protein-L-isoaspartate(D-aspartate) O-methyltransferase